MGERSAASLAMAWESLRRACTGRPEWAVRRPVARMKVCRHVRVVIVGAGFGGLCMAIQLKRAGFEDFVVLERASGLGGVWRDNVYPGAACDVASFLYSFSFAPKPDWSRRFAPQAEILSYAEQCTDRFGVRPHLRFDRQVERMVWDEATRSWTLHLRTGEPVRAEVVVNATGQLSEPSVPALPGADVFAGLQLHSARWRDDLDVSNADVAVLGTGASAIQIVPELARRARRLTVLQRSAPWVLRRGDRAVPAAWQVAFRASPALARTYRNWLYCVHEARLPALLSPGRLANAYARGVRLGMRWQVRDPKLRAQITPQEPLGCKRVLISDTYLQALQQPNVSLETRPLAKLVEGGVCLEDGEVVRASVLVYATGFRSTEFLTPMRVTGRGGVELSAAWRAGAFAYLGMTVPRFPNFFMLYGPNTNLGHSSILFMLERQSEYVLECVRALAEGRARSLEVRASAAAVEDAGVQAASADSVWSAGCHNWYRNAEGRQTNNWPFSTVRYWWRTRRVRLDDYHVEPWA